MLPELDSDEEERIAEEAKKNWERRVLSARKRKRVELAKENKDGTKDGTKDDSKSESNNNLPKPKALTEDDKIRRANLANKMKEAESKDDLRKQKADESRKSKNVSILSAQMGLAMNATCPHSAK